MRKHLASLALAFLAVALISFTITTSADAKVLGKTRYIGKQVLVSTGHNNPGRCYYSTDNGGSWQSAPWSLCARLGARKA